MDPQFVAIFWLGINKNETPNKQKRCNPHVFPLDFPFQPRPRLRLVPGDAGARSRRLAMRMGMYSLEV